MKCAPFQWKVLMPQYKEVQQAASSRQLAAGSTQQREKLVSLHAPCPMLYAYSLRLYPFNLGAHSTKLLFQPLVAPVEMIDPGYLGNAFGGQPGQDQRGTGP